MKILIIEDDENIVSFLKRGFKEAGYITESSTSGEEGEYLALVNKYDIIILDWMLPHKSGIDIIQTLREKKIKTPILFLTAKDTLENKIVGFRRGADDYLTKPFAYKELLVRMEAIYRRTLLNSTKNIIEIKNIQIDLNAKIMKKDGKKISLSQKEYELLIFLIKNKNSMVSNSMIESQLWNNEEFINSNVIQVTIYNLRKKIGKSLITNFRGLGYKIDT
ncbi:response regulator transcription factor [Arcobacter sp. LA11]|uniref:response regulator transcription factor n=1 Tax=Arcobacter sp. LA11 TaxID=1898176 RepID=UPI000935358A|nr:response regulator transcription factor [Arcobacter sp. LA11]